MNKGSELNQSKMVEKKLIVIEGLDGSGKNTQSKLLKKYFDTMGKKSICLSFPSYDKPYSQFIKMYLNSELGNNPDNINAYAISSFYAIDRFMSYKNDWYYPYNNGTIIICDRYTTSNAIYQMCKIPKECWNEYLYWLFDYEYNKLQIPKPDKVIYLKVPVELSQRLLKKRYLGDESKKDIHESNETFLKKCECSAKYVCEKYNWDIINCCDRNGEIKTVERIHEEIISLL